MLNKAILIGNVGADPEIKVSNGKEFAVFNLATSEKWKDKDTGDRKEKTEWHRIVVFSEHVVKLVKSYVKKGSKLYIDGQITQRKWTDDAGIERYASEICIKSGRHNITLLDSKPAGNKPPDDAYSE